MMCYTDGMTTSTPFNPQDFFDKVEREFDKIGLHSRQKSMFIVNDPEMTEEEASDLKEMLPDPEDLHVGGVMLPMGDEVVDNLLNGKLQMNIVEVFQIGPLAFDERTIRPAAFAERKSFEEIAPDATEMVSDHLRDELERAKKELEDDDW